ncbi:MAG TPA: hypothetical protein VN649_10025 [Ramlibacter sp.]|nr:hypothetical protein [Ramlibacter sp.]
MSDAADRLARTRLAIIKQIQQPEHRAERADAKRPRERETRDHEGPERRSNGGGAGWFARFRQAARTWWRYHPAHMGLELATPALSAFAERKPLQYVGIAAAVGAVVMITRPWRLISVGGLLVAVAKSSQLSTVLLSALSAADYPKDHEP